MPSIEKAFIKPGSFNKMFKPQPKTPKNSLKKSTSENKKKVTTVGFMDFLIMHAKGKVMLQEDGASMKHRQASVTFPFSAMTSLEPPPPEPEPVRPPTPEVKSGKSSRKEGSRPASRQSRPPTGNHAKGKKGRK